MKAQVEKVQRISDTGVQSVKVLLSRQMRVIVAERYKMLVRMNQHKWELQQLGEPSNDAGLMEFLQGYVEEKLEEHTCRLTPVLQEYVAKALGEEVARYIHPQTTCFDEKLREHTNTLTSAFQEHVAKAVGEEVARHIQPQTTCFDEKLREHTNTLTPAFQEHVAKAVGEEVARHMQLQTTYFDEKLREHTNTLTSSFQEHALGSVKEAPTSGGSARFTIVQLGYPSHIIKAKKSTIRYGHFHQHDALAVADAFLQRYCSCVSCAHICTHLLGLVVRIQPQAYN